MDFYDDEVEVCLNCPYEECIDCLANKVKKKERIEQELIVIEELLMLGKTMQEICGAVGISRRTYCRRINQLKERG